MADVAAALDVFGQSVGDGEGLYFCVRPQGGGDEIPGAAV